MSNILNRLKNQCELVRKVHAHRGAKLDFNNQQAYSFSVDYAARYLAARRLFDSAPSDDLTAIMATGRLEWLLRNVRRSLSGVFTEEDIVALLDCFHGDTFFPDQFDSLASELCVHLGVEVDDYQESYLAALVNKLLALNPAQRLTLAETLEQVWHIDLKEGTPIAEAFSMRGIKLS